MSGLFLLLCVVGMAIQGAFILMERKKKFRYALTLKMLASLVFIFAGVYCMQSCRDKIHAMFLVAGLIMGAVGDFFLNLQYVVKEKVQEVLFVVGAVAFLVGHVLYTISLMPYVQELLLVSAILAVVVTGVLMSWVYRHIVAAPGLKIFGLFYVGALLIFIIAALGRYFTQPTSIASLILALGGILFTVSDVVLFFDMFGKSRPWMRTANLVLYYVAQLVIASSLLYVM